MPSKCTGTAVGSGPHISLVGPKRNQSLGMFFGADPQTTSVSEVGRASGRARR